jgi:hypothetical protein
MADIVIRVELLDDSGRVVDARVLFRDTGYKDPIDAMKDFVQAIEEVET